MAMYQEDILEHVKLLQSNLSFEARVLYRFLQAAGGYYSTHLTSIRVTTAAPLTLGCRLRSLTCCPMLMSTQSKCRFHAFFIVSKLDNLTPCLTLYLPGCQQSCSERRQLLEGVFSLCPTLRVHSGVCPHSDPCACSSQQRIWSPK